MKNAFNELISKLATTKERISEGEDMLIEISKTKAKRKKTLKMEQEFPSWLGG